jgi:hypothetical protein
MVLGFSFASGQYLLPWQLLVGAKVRLGVRTCICAPLKRVFVTEITPKGSHEEEQLDAWRREEKRREENKPYNMAVQNGGARASNAVRVLV